MELVQMKVEEFTALLASEAQAPGGGSAAALEGALGAALVAMVCRLSVNRLEEECRRHVSATAEQAEALRSRFLEMVDRDTEAFLQVSAAYAMPKSAEEERAARSAAIQRGLLRCTEVPLEVMALAEEGLALAKGLLPVYNRNAASDLGVAALSLASAAQGAWMNVAINLKSLKDRETAERCRTRGESSLAEAEKLAEEVRKEVLAQLD